MTGIIIEGYLLFIENLIVIESVSSFGRKDRDRVLNLKLKIEVSNYLVEIRASPLTSAATSELVPYLIDIISVISIWYYDNSS